MITGNSFEKCQLKVNVKACFLSCDNNVITVNQNIQLLILFQQFNGWNYFFLQNCHLRKILLTQMLLTNDQIIFNYDNNNNDRTNAQLAHISSHPLSSDNILSHFYFTAKTQVNGPHSGKLSCTLFHNYSIIEQLEHCKNKGKNICDSKFLISFTQEIILFWYLTKNFMNNR